MKVGVVINTASGGYDSESEDEMLDIVKHAGIVQPKIWCDEADEIERSFTEAARQKLEVLVVLGGDGTVRRAAEACAAQGLYLSRSPEER